ncbi:hypothetical protein ACFX19_014208 [Malus domestica]
MSVISFSKFITFSSISSSSLPKYPTMYPSFSPKFPPYHITHSSRKLSVLVFSKPSKAEEENELSLEPEDEWLKKLLDKKKPLGPGGLAGREARVARAALPRRADLKLNTIIVTGRSNWTEARVYGI